MNDPEVERLIKKESPKEKDNLFLSYIIYVFPSLLIVFCLSLVIYVALRILPVTSSAGLFPPYGFFGWAAALSAGMMLAILTLMGLLQARIKSKKTASPKAKPGRFVHIDSDGMVEPIIPLAYFAWGIYLGAFIVYLLRALIELVTKLQESLRTMSEPLTRSQELRILAEGIVSSLNPSRALLVFLALIFYFLLFIIVSYLVYYGLRPIIRLLVPGIDSEDKAKKVELLFWEQLRERNFPCYVVTDEEREEDKIVQRIKGNPYSEFARGCGLIISDCDHAVAVTDGFEFKGVKEPGTTLTGFADEPLRTLDLRPQLRTFTPRAFTKDGIQVEALVFAPFQIDRGGQQIEIGKKFPFRTQSAIRAVQAQRMEHPGTAEPAKQRSWDELPELIGTPILQSILSRYTFDELYDPFMEQDKLPRIRIAEELLAEMKKELAKAGIELIGGGISNIRPVDEQVIEERIRSWQAEWQRRTLVEQAKSHRQWLQQVERARAEAQAELILSLGKKLAELQPGSGLPPEQLMSQFLNTLEQMMMQPGLRGRFSPSMRGELQRLQEGL